MRRERRQLRQHASGERELLVTGADLLRGSGLTACRLRGKAGRVQLQAEVMDGPKQCDSAKHQINSKLHPVAMRSCCCAMCATARHYGWMEVHPTIH
jgi:hypothetical protein